MSNILRQILLKLLPLLLWPALGLSAEAYQSLQEISEAVKASIQQEYDLDAGSSVEVGHLDPRLRLKRCSQPLQTFYPQSARNAKTTVGVRCPGAQPWTIYVSVSISRITQVWVAKQYLRRGSLIRAEDFVLKAYDLNRLQYGYFTDLKAVLGKSLKRHLNQGAVLTPSSVAVNKVVKRGEQVTILAETGGISIHAKGEALEAGGIGDIIRVKNLNSNKEIEARITGPGHVKVDL